MATTGATCGKLTLSGRPCKNAPGCKLPHPVQRKISATNRSAAINRAVEAALIDQDRFEAAPRQIAENTSEMLRDKQIFPHNSPNNVEVHEIADLIKDYPQGFTVAPAANGGKWGTPPGGICVALRGTDLKFTRDVAANSRPGTSTVEGANDFDSVGDWLQHLKPLFDTGHVWIGGWYDENNDCYEINATLVFPQSERETALLVAANQNQYSAWDCDANNGNGAEIIVGGDGSGSRYNTAGPARKQWKKWRRRIKRERAKQPLRNLWGRLLRRG